jgi:hypothetical protein
VSVVLLCRPVDDSPLCLFLVVRLCNPLQLVFLIPSSSSLSNRSSVRLLFSRTVTAFRITCLSAARTCLETLRVHTPSSEVGDAARLSRDSGSYDAPSVSTRLRFKDFKHLTLRSTKDPITFLVWWLRFITNNGY